MARTKTQRSKRQFETRREGLMRKINEMNRLTTARVALIGTYKGKMFSYEPEEGLLQRFGLTTSITECFGSDDVVGGERTIRVASPKESVSSDFASTDPSCDSSLDSPVPHFLRKTSAAPLEIMDSSSSIVVRQTDKAPKQVRRWRKGNIYKLDMDFF